MTRFLYILVAVLVVVVGQRSWSLHQTITMLNRTTVQQSYGAAADTARVTIHAFFNYTHRPSRNISASVMDVVSRNPDTRLVFHPVPSGSLMALQNAQIAYAAARQGKFIAMHEELVRNEKPLIETNIREMANRIGVDPDLLIKDMNGPEVALMIKRESDLQKRLKIYASPLFLINQKWLYGPDSEGAVYGDLLNLIQKARSS